MLLRILLLLVWMCPFHSFADVVEKKIVVIVPSYNNLHWFRHNLNSIIKQEYSHFRVLYLDDSSKDGMGLAVDDFVRKHVGDYYIAHFDDDNAESVDARTESFCRLVNENRHFFTVIHNVNRCGALENLYRSIVSTDDDEIIVTVDGDDWLAHHGVLQELNEVYSSNNVWMTHGCLKQFPSGIVAWSIPIPDDIVATNAFRSYRCPSHLRTFYSWLFKKIKLEDLLFEGKFFSMTWDMAMMYPMIEMAGERHAFIENPNYVYNQANQINDNKVNAQLQRDLDVLIRAKEPYQRLD